nr:hypothetical protein [Nitrosomonas eutropha]
MLDQITFHLRTLCQCSCRIGVLAGHQHNRNVQFALFAQQPDKFKTIHPRQTIIDQQYIEISSSFRTSGQERQRILYIRHRSQLNPGCLLH